MPIKIIKKSFEYSTYNIFFFIFVLILMFLCQILSDIVDSVLVGFSLMCLIMMGYGLQVTRDVINGGVRLPKIMPFQTLIFGVKGSIISLFYYFIQTFLLFLISVNLNFPDSFNIKEFFLNYSKTMYLFRHHDPVSFTIFVLSSIIVVYITVFFMEIALGSLADDGKLENSFNFRKIKRVIDIIGWRSYIIDYTKIILSIIILTFLLNHPVLRFEILDNLLDAVFFFLIFIVQYIGIGQIFSQYKEKKSKIEE